MKNPKIFSSSVYEALGTLVSCQEYHCYDRRDDLPAKIRGICGYSSSDKYVGTIIAASSTGSNPPTIGGIVPASSAPIYRVLEFRKDTHSDGNCHVNRDDALFFKDTGGRTLKMTATDKSAELGHFLELASDSRLDIPHDICEFPNEPHGTLDNLRKSGVSPHFSTAPYRDESKK